MNDIVGLEERDAGPSWARPNWPIAELDELNLGLDPTAATIEKVAGTLRPVCPASSVCDAWAVYRPGRRAIGVCTDQKDPFAVVRSRATTRPCVVAPA